jgi:hypothetical protein
MDSNKKIKAIHILAITLSLALFGITSSASANKAESAKSLVSAMSAAHGGYENWLNAPSFSYTIVMPLLPLPIIKGRTYSDNWRYYSVTIDPDTSRGYVNLPHENMAGYEVGFDGTRLWRTAYKFDPTFQDPPWQLLWYHYGMVSLPFLANVPGTLLERRDNESLPGIETSFPVVRMTFNPNGKARGGFIDLFIDPKTHLLKAWRQGVRVPLLPNDPIPANVGASSENIVRVVESYHRVDGYIVPKAYISLNSNGKMSGYHLVLEASFTKPFDETAIIAPKNAQ